GPRQLGSRLAGNPPGRLLHAWWYHAWGFDWLYRWLWVRPYLFLVALHQRDWIDASLGLVARLAAACHRVLSLTQTGRLRWYVTSITIGAVAMLATLVFLYPCKELRVHDPRLADTDPLSGRATVLAGG